MSHAMTAIVPDRLPTSDVAGIHQIRTTTAAVLRRLLEVTALDVAIGIALHHETTITPTAEVTGPPRLLAAAVAHPWTIRISRQPCAGDTAVRTPTDPRLLVAVVTKTRTWRTDTRAPQEIARPHHLEVTEDMMSVRRQDTGDYSFFPSILASYCLPLAS